MLDQGKVSKHQTVGISSFAQVYEPPSGYKLVAILPSDEGTTFAVDVTGRDAFTEMAIFCTSRGMQWFSLFLLTEEEFQDCIIRL
jgi:hypothetical protein